MIWQEHFATKLRDRVQRENVVAHSAIASQDHLFLCLIKFAAQEAACGYCHALLLYQNLLLVAALSNARLELARIHYSAATRL